MASGSIHKRERGGRVFWQAVVDLGPDPATGKRRQRATSYKTQREARAGLAAWLADLQSGRQVTPSRMTLAELLRYWLQTHAAPRVRATTLESYTLTIEQHLIPALGAVPVQQVTPALLHRYYADKLAAGAHPRVVQLCHLRLKQALALAVTLEIAPRNAAEGVTPPPAPPRPRAVWDAAEARRFLDAAAQEAARGQGYGPIWLLLLATGLRRGEALGLRWRDVDLAAGLLHVRQSLVRVGGQMVAQPPKTQSSRRGVPLVAVVVEALREHRRRQSERRLALGPDWHGAGGGDELVFATKLGTPISGRNLVRAFDGLCRRARVPRIRIHDLRHVAVTLAISGGAPLKATSEMVGHRDSRVTMEVYAHAAPDERRVVAETIAAALIPSPSPLPPSPHGDEAAGQGS